MDLLKALRVKIGGSKRSQNHSNYNFKTSSFRTLIVKDYKGYKFNIDEYGDFFCVNFTINSDLAFSINNADRLFGFITPISLHGFPYTLYVAIMT